jgi:hypothetical protein
VPAAGNAAVIVNLEITRIDEIGAVTRPDPLALPRPFWTVGVGFGDPITGDWMVWSDPGATPLPAQGTALQFDGLPGNGVFSRVLPAGVDLTDIHFYIGVWQGSLDPTEPRQLIGDHFFQGSRDFLAAGEYNNNQAPIYLLPESIGAPTGSGSVGNFQVEYRSYFEETSVPVPEPSSVLLFAAGVGALAGAKRHVQRASDRRRLTARHRKSGGTSA